MKRISKSLLVLIAAAAVVAVTPLTAWAAEVVRTVAEDFEGGSNEGAWTFGTGNERIVATNGNPGAYLRDDTLVSFHPKASTSFGTKSEFTGSYRRAGVTSVGIDLATIDATSNVSSRTIVLILLNDNKTPFDLEDDWGAIHVTDLPVPPAGVIGDADILNWVSYDIDVPSQSETVPPGWEMLLSPDAKGPQNWVRLMRNVSHVGFSYGDPRIPALIASYKLGMDNPRITTETRR